jgi:hypothetical protein
MIVLVEGILKVTQRIAGVFNMVHKCTLFGLFSSGYARTTFEERDGCIYEAPQFHLKNQTGSWIIIF